MEYMPPRAGQPAIGVLVSGGLDSCVLAAHLSEQGREVQPFYVRSGLVWQEAEITALRRFLAALDRPIRELVVLDLPLADLYADHWSVTGRGTPDAETPDDAVYLHGRNAMLTIKPLLWCQMHGIRELALATLRSNPFSDATEEFFGWFELALNKGARGCNVKTTRPFSAMDKLLVMREGEQFPIHLTFSCIAPVGGRHCGRCNKCAERKHAFVDAGIVDRTEYADAC
jgi:7-cyano-7-deazaguanine synthase